MIAVVAGVLYKDGRIMAYQRPEGKDLAGRWEFPGGKLEAGESPEEALCRELEEELDIRVKVGAVLDVLRSKDPQKDILLMFYACTSADTPRPMENGAVRFVLPQDLQGMDFAPMDRLFLQRGGVARLMEEMA